MYKTKHTPREPKYSRNTSYIFSENIYWSPVRRQWLVAFDSNGTVAGLIPRLWTGSKTEALQDLKSALEFRLGLTADCTILYQRLDRLNKELDALLHARELNRQASERERLGGTK